MSARGDKVRGQSMGGGHSPSLCSPHAPLEPPQRSQPLMVLWVPPGIPCHSPVPLPPVHLLMGRLGVPLASLGLLQLQSLSCPLTPGEISGQELGVFARGRTRWPWGLVSGGGFGWGLCHCGYSNSYYSNHHGDTGPHKILRLALCPLRLAGSGRLCGNSLCFRWFLL